MTRCFTLDRAAKRVHVSRRTVERWIHDGRLRAVTLDGKRYVYLPDLLRCERERRRSRGNPGARVELLA